MTGPVFRAADELFDVILSRPNLIFGEARKLPLSVLQRARALEALGNDPKRQISEVAKNEQYLLPKGNVIAGGITTDALVKRLGIQPVTVGAETVTPKAIRDLTGSIRMDWSEAGVLKVELPHRVTDEQVKHLSRFFDNNQIPAVQLIDAKGEIKPLVQPLGAQFEDAVFETAKGYATRSSRLTPELIDQFKKQGVFKGQAGVLDDGSPVEIRTKSGFNYIVYDHTAKKEMNVHSSKLTILPTTLDDQLKPNNIFSGFLSDEEKLGLTRLRRSLESGLGQPITKFPQLELFAGTRGFVAERLGKGKVALVDMASGERQTFENLPAAVSNIRTINRPAPDVTPDEIKRLLGGDTNIGFVGLNGRPPMVGEQVPVPTNIVAENRATQDKLPGAWEYIVKPMRGLFQDIQQRTGLPFGDIFLNIQARTVERQNWNARWLHGKGRPLPNQIKSLDVIRKMAGKDADEDTITAWLEAGKDTPTRETIEAGMSGGELAAAKELRKWYDELWKELEIPADFLENYVPHWRVQAHKYGNDLYEIYRASNPQMTQIPKAARFFADYYRTGVMDIYDTKAFRMAYRYAHSGSSNRFMSEPLDQAATLLKGVEDRALVKPMSDYLEALRGFEFFEQKQMIERTLERIFSKLPGINQAAKRGVVDKLSDLAIGMGYMSSLAYRLPAVLRNYTQILHTTYPIFGGANGAFMEGIGRAMTKAGKLQAIEDGAISFKSASEFSRQQLGETGHPALDKFFNLGFKMYDNADEFTRASTYWIARENAMKSIQKYAGKLDGANPARSKRALEQLKTDAKLNMFEDNVQNEFLRRMVNDPESAARFIGKQFSDVTQFLYGRGMQPYWMRSVWGKFLGQYGTWSLWYLDYITRTVKNLSRNGQTGEAIKFIGRNTLVNMAILGAGHEVLEIDLSRWTSYSALFYSGGPGAQIAVGMMDVMRGMSDISTMSESPFAKSKFNEGLHTLARSGLSFIPFRSAARDAQRVTEAMDNGTWTEVLAASLGAKPTNDYTIGQQLDALFPGQPLAYEEWLRYRPGAPPGPSASSMSEVEFYRSKLPTESTPQGGLPPVSQRTPEQLGVGVPLAPVQAQPVPRPEPSAESEPLQR